ncbi:unnamed protein product [Boreogadus saida]
MGCCDLEWVYTFGLFTVDIFVNAGQVVTGNLAPYFLTVCKPNFTALGCQQALRYISHQEACTGDQGDILRARKTFPSKEAALSVYGALYLAMYVTCTVRAKGTRLAKPVVSLTLVCLAFLTGLNRVAEYRNHWADVIAGFVIGGAIATFLTLIRRPGLQPVVALEAVVCVVHNFKGKLLLGEDPPPSPSQDPLPGGSVLNMGRVDASLEKYIASQETDDDEEEEGGWSLRGRALALGRWLRDGLVRLYQLLPNKRQSNIWNADKGFMTMEADFQVALGARRAFCPDMFLLLRMTG